MSLTYKSTNSFHNYGKIINELASKYNWVLTRRKVADLSNKNSQSTIKCYLDGMEIITLKHNLANLIKDENYSIETHSLEDFEETKNNKTIYFVKPSHEYVGSGKSIYITNEPKKLILDKSLKWIVQKEIKPSLYLNNKWDIRHYALVLYNKNKVNFFMFKDCLARLNPLVYSKGNEDSQLTNISITETFKEYSSEKHMIKCHDSYFDKLKPMVYGLLLKASEYATPVKEEIGYLILGFDTMFSNNVPNLKKLSPLEEPSDKFYPVLIEVNAQPSMEVSNTVEGIISQEFWKSLLTIAFPSILKNKNINHDFDKFHFLFSTNSKYKENSSFAKPKYIPSEIKEYIQERNQ